MTNKNNRKIWKEIKPHINKIENYMNTFIHLAEDMGDEKEQYRYDNIKRSFNRGIMMAASAKYLPVKNKPTHCGYDFNAPAIFYCYVQLFSDIIKKNKAANAEVIPTASEIDEESNKWTFLSIHEEITDAAIKTYNENGDFISSISVFVKDKSLDWSSPVVGSIKGFFKKLF